MHTHSRRARPALLAAVFLAALAGAGCSQTGTRSMGGPATMPPPDEPVGGRAVIRPVPPGQNLPGGDSSDAGR